MKKNSLRQFLYNLIKTKGTVSLDDIEYLCHTNHKKLSNAERRLRHSECSWASPIKNAKGAIIGYKYIDYQQAVNNALKEGTGKLTHEMAERAPTVTVEPHRPSLAAETYNETLLRLIRETKPTFDNAERLKELNKAFKKGSGWVDFKKSIIRKYENRE